MYDSLWHSVTLKMDDVWFSVAFCHSEDGWCMILRDILSLWRWRRYN